MTSAIKDHELDYDAPGWFHSSDGWYWRRCADGSVAIVRRIQEPDDRGARIYRITAAHRLTASQWASIVAHASARGETGETFRAALAFHEGEPVRKPEIAELAFDLWRIKHTPPFQQSSDQEARDLAELRQIWTEDLDDDERAAWEAAAAARIEREPAAPAPDPAEDSYQAAVTVYRQSRALELDDTLDERPARKEEQR